MHVWAEPHTAIGDGKAGLQKTEGSRILRYTELIESFQELSNDRYPVRGQGRRSKGTVIIADDK